MPSTELEPLRTRLRKLLAASPTAEFLRHSGSRWESAWSEGRAPDPGEIREMESRGNACEDWAGIRFLGRGPLTGISECRFEGRIAIRLNGGSTRLWRSRLRDCFIGVAGVEDAGLLDRVWMEDGAWLRRVGEITGGSNSRYCLGRAIHPGDETASRRVWLLDGTDIEDCARMASLPLADQETLARDICEAEEATDFTFIGPGARIELTTLIEDSFIGRGAVIRGAASVRRCILASTPGAPPIIGTGAIAEDAILAAGARVESAGQVSRCLLLECSSVEKAGQAADSVLGPNTHVAKGEVTASLVGPFVGFHHQALLIGALWPEGRGNVGYGANVGSNHTGRKPDQEIRPGEGAFFGLGCSIKFPANFSEAPYSLFATGITVPPQRLAFPFSLITSPSEISPTGTEGLNEILPGWMWGGNAYALIRNAYKFQDREQRILRSEFSDSPLCGTFLAGYMFAPRIAISALRALEALRRAAAGPTKIFYLEPDLPGLGKNFLRRENLAAAIAAYENHARLASLQLLLRDDAPELTEQEIRSLDPAAWFDGLRRSVENSLAKDGKRGAEIFEDYSAFHGEPARDPVCIRLGRDCERLLEPLRERLKTIIARRTAG